LTGEGKKGKMLIGSKGKDFDNGPLKASLKREKDDYLRGRGSGIPHQPPTLDKGRRGTALHAHEAPKRIYGTLPARDATTIESRAEETTYKIGTL